MGGEYSPQAGTTEGSAVCGLSFSRLLYSSKMDFKLSGGILVALRSYEPQVLPFSPTLLSADETCSAIPFRPTKPPPTIVLTIAFIAGLFHLLAVQSYRRNRENLGKIAGATPPGGSFVEI